MALLMNADTFRFNGWDYMNLPAESCAEQRVSVEFVDSRAGRSSQVEFTFQRGRIIRAAGWQRSIESGSITRPEVQD